MKKTLLLSLLAFAGISAKAQQFPDFVANDINGNPHSVQEYLDQGKVVLLDISATWCGPCWMVHESHAMENVYYTYGPGGSDEVVVLFVEGDEWTPLNNIYGEGTSINYNPARPPIGDWTEGVPYPIINDDNLAAEVNLLGFPSMYRICPDGTYIEIPNSQVTQFANGQNTLNIINNLNQCVALQGAQRHSKIDTNFITVCDQNTNGVPYFNITNYGTEAITSAVINLKDAEGTVVATKNYTGNLARYRTTAIQFDETALEEGTYTIEIEGINEDTPFQETTTNLEVKLAQETARNIVVKVYTDNYPGEISWTIKDSNGEIVAEEGPYQPGPGQDQGGGPDANTTKTHNITLPEGVDCYTIEVKDSWGDGWSLGTGETGIEIFENDGITSVYKNILDKQVFETFILDNAFKSDGTMDNESFTSGKFSVYPNPTTGILNFTTQEPVDVTVMDLTGKVVFTAKNVNDGGSINLSSLQSGMYIAKINSQTAERIEKIVIK